MEKQPDTSVTQGVRRFIHPLPDISTLVVKDETSRRYIVKDYLGRIMHAPNRSWFDLYTPLEVNGVSLGNGGFVITIFSFSSIDEKVCPYREPDKFYNLAESIIHEEISHFCINHVVEIDGHIVTIAVFSRCDQQNLNQIGPSLVAGIQDRCQLALTTLHSQYGVQMKCFVGGATFGISSLPDSYEKVYNFWAYDEFLAGYRLPSVDIEYNTDQLIVLAKIREYSDQLVHTLAGSEFSKATEIFSSILDRLAAEQPPMLLLFRSRLLTFILSFTDKLIGHGVFTEADIPVADMLNQIHRASCYLELRTSLVQCVELLMAIRLRRQKVNSNELIRQAKDYVSSHYSNSGLSVSEMAESFGISQTHLSAVFKKQTQESLIDYIHKIRISHAVTLLESSSMSINEVCSAVGYGSISTMFRSFQKYRNTTPSSYRRLSR